MKLPPMTQNQKLILSFLASTAAGAVSAVIAAVVQSYTQQGLNIPVLINVALIAFGAFFGPALVNYVPNHIQQILAAANDTTVMLQRNLQQTQQAHAAMAQTVQTLAQVAQKQAVAAAQPVPLQGSAQPAASGSVQLNSPATNANWMLDKPVIQQPQPPLQGVQQLPFPPARPVPPLQPVEFPAVKPPMATVNMANTPVDVSQQQTGYQPIPSDLHFGDSQIMPAVGQ
jgi:hypothetical protein